ncbi:keratin, type I cytoskeletal 18-like [Vanacampus margaritifer]
MEPRVVKRNAQRGALLMSYAPTVYGGAGGHGIKISTSSSGSRVRNRYSGGYEYESAWFNPGTLAIENEKFALQQLNDRLASYMETVKSLEKANSKLEFNIREAVEKRGPLEGKDFSKYNAIIADLRAKILGRIKGNMQLAIALDNANLASEDFRIKMQYELSMHQTVEADVGRLRKILDDTNMIRMNLESEIESLKEDLIKLKKNRDIEVAELRAKITHVGVHVDVDAPKGQDIARVMEEMRATYEKIILKNAEEVKEWHESKFTEVQVKVTEQTTALKEATTELNKTTRRYQAMEIELQSALSLLETLKATIRDIEMRSSMEMEKYNEIILRFTEELTRIRTVIQQDRRDYELLLNIKIKLEAEIMEYRRLLDGGKYIK